MSLAPFDIETGMESEESMEVARRELRETPEIKEAAIKELRRMLHENTDLHYRDDDDFLITFLRPCHYYPESAMKMLRAIADFKKNNDKLLHNVMPEDEKSAFIDHDIVNVLTNRDHKGRRILIVNCGECWDPKQVNSDQLFRLFYLVHLVAQLEPETQSRGVVCIMDFKGLGMKQVKALSPQFSMRLLTFIQDAMPLRMKEIHMVNQPFIFRVVWELFRPFIREKLKKRIFFHGSDFKKLHVHLEASHLPANYGGKLPKTDYSGRDWYPCVKQYEEHCRQWTTFGYANAHN